MITLSGYFKDINGDDIFVEIKNQSDQDITVTINEEDSDIWFAGQSPVSITQDVENEFQHILSKSCTINLLCKNFVGDYFFPENVRDCEVSITKRVTVGHMVRQYLLFQGYVEPLTFSQGFAHQIESFTLNCHDILGTLEYLNYKDLTLSDYDEAKANATNVTFKEMLLDILDGCNIWYDQSRGIDSSSCNTIFNDIGLFEVYLLGEEYDSIWNKKQVIEEILRYLNLHIVQVGQECYIFDWETLSTLSETRWYSIRFNNYKSRQGYFVELGKENYAADDLTISISDVYNQIQVTDELEALETIIESPLDDNNLINLYGGNRIQYMTEYIAEGEENDARTAFYHMVDGEYTDYEDAKEITWYVMPAYNPLWKLNYDSSRIINDLVEYDENGEAINPYKLPLAVQNKRCTSLIMKAGSIEKKPDTDTSPVAKVDMTPYLFISVLGNNGEVDEYLESFPGSDEITKYYTSMGYRVRIPYPAPNNTELENLDNTPIIEYTSNQTGGTFSPPDDDTINYLVFSGKMCLMPRVQECDHYINVRARYGSGRDPNKAISSDFWRTDPKYDFINSRRQGHYDGDYFVNTGFNCYAVSGTKNEDNKRFYTRQFYKNRTAKEKDVTLSGYETGVFPSHTYTSLHMYTDDKVEYMLPYQYTATGTGDRPKYDRLHKLPILECELIIGNKRCVEIDVDEETGEGKFVWIDKNSGIDCSFIDDNGDVSTYVKTTFSLGIDPKIADDNYIIGKEYDLQNTIDLDYDLVEAEGTAIPITKADALTGKVEFRIKGPINNMYSEVTRRHPTWFRHTKYNEKTRSVLSHTESIIIKDFEAKLYTSGSVQNNDSDLVYVSDELDRYISKADDITFKFITQLGKEESIQKGISPTTNQNAVLNFRTNTPLVEIYNANTQEVAKPEEHYVDQYFRIYSKPRVVMQTTLKDNGISFENLYYATGIEKDSYVLGISQDLKMNTATVKLKEGFTG